MDLNSQLANLTLAEIANFLNPKHQEVLLTSISVAAYYIQQLQAEEQQLQAEEQQQQQQQQHQPSKNQKAHQKHNQREQKILPQQLLLQQQAAAAAAAAAASAQLDNTNQLHSQHRHLNNTQLNISNLNNNTTINTTTTTNDLLDGTLDDEDEEEEDDDEDDDQFEDEDQFLDSEDGHSFTPHRQQRHHRQQQQQHHHNNTLNNSQDGEVLRTIREFAEELKHRRKSIRLSQKGAAQSLRAFTSGEHPCTDAIIYHFENLQLEPDRAMQLIPLLRDWLEWAEKHRLNGKQLPMMSAVTKVPRERKRKVVLFNEKAKQYLEDAFLRNNHPDRYQLDVISQELNIPTRSIRKWFTNRRQRKRFAEKFSPVN